MKQATDVLKTYAEMLVESADVMIYIINKKGEILYANQAACSNLGYSLDEFTAKNVLDFDPLYPRDEFEEGWRRLCEQKSLNLAGKNTRRDGTVFPYQATVSLIEGSNDSLASLFVYDDTERSKKEEQALFRNFIFEKAAVGIYKLDAAGKIVDVNEEACKMLGYTRNELCGMMLEKIDSSLDATTYHDEHDWEEALKAGTLTLESIHMRKDGSTIPVRVIANFLKNDGKYYAISCVQDISKEKKEEKLRQELSARAQHLQRLDSLGKLAGGIAHDFNNILSAILGYSELARRTLNDDKAVRNFIEPIILAGNRAKDLVKQILVFSRQQNTEKIPTDLALITREALDLIRATIPKSIEITEKIEPDLGVILADSTHMHQVIMNLCTNAYQAMKNKKGSITVEICQQTITEKDIGLFSEFTPGSYIKLSIADDGTGMDEDILENIFTPYFSTKLQEEGTGLGLSTVHGIIKEHGGIIKVYSEKGIGSTFNIYLPVDDNYNQYLPDVSATDLPKGNETILLVDDEVFILDIEKMLLEDLGYTIETRNSPIDGLQAFKANPQKYDLVISDLTMPKMLGTMFSAALKEIRPDVPIILCSGFSNAKQRQQLKKIGVQTILMKPVPLVDLANTVRQHLDNVISA